MKKIREKLCSESGASILLALLFFLLCAMVGASVLMAAASNAGKSRSNREEQQKYLTLSSALQLVCDELTAAEYTAKYDFIKIEHTKKVIVTDEAGNKTEMEEYDYTEHKYTMFAGDFQCGLSKSSNIVLPLFEELEWIFKNNFNGPNEESGDPRKTFKVDGSVKVTEPVEHTLTLTVNQDDKPGLNEPVTVTVELGTEEGKDKWRFSLKAELESDPSYTMYAELNNSGVPKIEEGKSGCDPIGWELSQITREEPK